LEACKYVRLAKRRKRAEEHSEKERNVELTNPKVRMAQARSIETVDEHSYRFANDAQRHVESR
jgi:hypothetical protein